MDDVAAIAAWLADAGYPYDWSNEVPPPEPLRRAMEDEWVRREGNGEDDEIIRTIVAEEGGWTENPLSDSPAPDSGIRPEPPSSLGTPDSDVSPSAATAAPEGAQSDGSEAPL